MSATQLPRHTGDVWRGGFVFESPQRTSVLSASSGVILAAGDRLHVIEAGAQGVRARDLPDGMGTVVSVAVEPRRRPRLAVCSAAMIWVIDGKGVATLRNEEGPGFSQVAWGRVRGGTVLYVLGIEGYLRRSGLNKGDFEEMDIEGVGPLASDANGTLALVATEPDPRVWVTMDGEEWFFRAMPPDSEEGMIHLAVAGEAVALTLVDQGKTWISRRRDDSLVRCEALDGAGPLAFEGVRADAALFAAVPVGGLETIVRVDAKGDVTRIAELGTGEGGGEPPLVAEMAWDATRKTLWYALPSAGLAKSEAPRTKGGGPRSLS
jgi:hypothetical protein